MDSFDIAILKALQADSRITTEALGERVGLSASACQRRIKKLKASGVIEKEVAVLDRTQLPGFITVIVDVILDKGGERALDAFIAKMEKEPRIQQFYYVAGQVDFVLLAVVQNMQEFDELTRQLLMSDKNVKKFLSKVVVTPNKVGSELPL